METFRIRSFLYLILLLSLVWSEGCEKDPGEPSVHILVMDESNGTPIRHAFLFHGNEFLGISGESGTFPDMHLEPGTIALRCSAVGFADRDQKVHVNDRGITNATFPLTADDQTGRVYGELHDLEVFREQLTGQPEMARWTGRELFDGVTGATLFFDYDQPPATIRLGDSLMAYADGYGQFWFEVQAGTYPLTAVSEGYKDTMEIVEVIPDTRTYVIFFLDD